MIKSTKTNVGLKVDCILDESEYKRGIEVSKEEFDAIKIKPHHFNGEWNYTIWPQKVPIMTK